MINRDQLRQAQSLSQDLDAITRQRDIVAGDSALSIVWSDHSGKRASALCGVSDEVRDAILRDLHKQMDNVEYQLNALGVDLT